MAVVVAVTPEVESPVDAGSPPNGLSAAKRRKGLGERSAVYFFAAILVLAFGGILWFGRHQWFAYDEWDFLASRNGGNIHDLFRPHNEHLTALPIIAYRILYRLFGLRTYLPYRILIVLVHLTVVVLLRAVMRRAGVGPWIATIAASAFAWFGSGWQAIVWPFSITLVGSVAFGLAQLLLADHDGPLDRRDWFGLAAGVGALLCSGVGVPMVAAVGVTVMLRRGLRAALVHTVPLGVFYLAWFETAGRHYGRWGRVFNSPNLVTYKPGLLIRFTQDGIAGALKDMGQLPGIGVLIGILLLAGFVMLWDRGDPTDLRVRLAAPLGLLTGAIVFLVVTGSGRAEWYGAIFAADTSRYVYITAALMVPAIGVAAAAVITRWRLLTPVVLALGLVGVPGNIQHMTPPANDVLYSARAAQSVKDLVETLPRQPYARQLDPSYQPSPALPGVTIGWLVHAADTGKLPPLRPDAVTRATLALQSNLVQSHKPVPPGVACSPITKLLGRQLLKGQSLVFKKGVIRVAQVTAGKAGTYAPITDGVSFDANNGQTLTAVNGPLLLFVDNSPFSSGPAVICG